MSTLRTPAAALKTAFGTVLAAGATLALAAPATQAASITVTAGAIVIDASEADDHILIAPADAGFFTYTNTHVDIKDFNQPLTSAPGCLVGPLDEPHLEENEARCPTRPGITVNLGAGNDSFTVYEPTELPFPTSLTVDGGAGDDDIKGASGNDVLRGGPGDDVLRGYAGNDVLEGGDGNDQLSGHTGDDRLDGGAGDDNLEADQVSFTSSDATAGADTLIGGPGKDETSYFMRSGPLRITLDGVADDGSPGEGDNIHPDVESVGGGWGDDTIIGSDNGHTLWGDLGNDTIIGGAGNDKLFGDDGADTVSGGAGDDEIKGGCHDDVITGGPGRDTLIADGCDRWLKVGLLDTIHANDGEADALIFCSDARDLAIGDLAIVDAIDPVTTSGPGACATVQVKTPVVGGPDTGAPGGQTGVPTGKHRKIAGGLSLITGTGKAGSAPKLVLGLKARRLTLGILLWNKAGKVRVSATAKLGRRTLSLGAKTFKLAGGAPQTLQLKVPKKTTTALRARKKVAVKVAYKIGKKTHRGNYSVTISKK